MLTEAKYSWCHSVSFKRTHSAAYKSYASENAEFEDLLFDERGRYIF